jgi:hypothetical protein
VRKRGGGGIEIERGRGGLRGGGGREIDGERMGEREQERDFSKIMREGIGREGGREGKCYRGERVRGREGVSESESEREERENGDMEMGERERGYRGRERESQGGER